MNNIWTTIKKELRGILRDRKSLMMMLLTPLMIPTFMILFSSIYDSEFSDVKEETKTYEIGVNYQTSDIENQLLEQYSLKTKYYKDQKSLEKAYQQKAINCYVIKEDTNYTIYSNQADTDSLEKSSIVNSYLEAYNSYLGHEYLSNFPVDFDKVDNSISIQLESLEGKNDFVNMILFMGIVFSIMSISLTAIYGVTDTIAGEKERGTLETLLTFPIKTKELMIGKYLAIIISCAITSLISSTLVVVSTYISKTHFSIFDGAILEINIKSIFLILVLMISYSLFVSGISIAIASFTKSYKEAQSALTPISLMTMIPMIMNMMEIELNTKISFIPLISHTMLINDIITYGITSTTILYLLIIVLSTLIYSYILLEIIGKLYKNEKILFSV